MLSGYIMRLSIKTILQWNLNSLQSKRGKLEKLIEEKNVEIVALQEIKNKKGRRVNIRGFNVYKKDRNEHGGGVLLAINNNIPSTQLDLATDLEAVACTAHYKGIQLNMCNLYLPEHEIITVNQLHMHTKVFSTKVVSMHRASDTKPKNHQNLCGKPLLKKLDDETPKKVRVQT